MKHHTILSVWGLLMLSKNPCFYLWLKSQKVSETDLVGLANVHQATFSLYLRHGFDVCPQNIL